MGELLGVGELVVQSAAQGWVRPPGVARDAPASEVTTSATASGSGIRAARSHTSAASSAESQDDSGRGASGLSRSSARTAAGSTRPLWLSRQAPLVNGAVADSSTGMPTVALRTAATTHPEAITPAMDA